ncbi:MAG TPA: hypothetical protein ENJ37_04100 [Deltaproteobacteria bacterium]|nr:hypothetical protein [Deltaproteobacteria bacterium]
MALLQRVSPGVINHSFLNSLRAAHRDEREDFTTGGPITQRVTIPPPTTPERVSPQSTKRRKGAHRGQQFEGNGGTEMPVREGIIILDRAGQAVEYSTVEERRRYIRFPVTLSVRFKGRTTSGNDFVLNASRGGLFIKTENLLPRGSLIEIELFIPPDGKRLGEFKGKVVGVNADESLYAKGLHVEFVDCNKEELDRLVDFLEERRHLVDERA